MDDTLRAQVDAEIEAGRLWKARDLLIAALRFDEGPGEASERLGQILQQMHANPLEIGRYYFFGGNYLPEYERYIGPFLEAFPPGHNAAFYREVVGPPKFQCEAWPPSLLERLSAEGVDFNTTARGRLVSGIGFVMLCVLLCGVVVCGLYRVVMMVL